MRTIKIDKVFLMTTLLLMLAGFIIFTSAALGLLAGGGTEYYSVAFNHIVFGIIFGSVALIVMSRISYKHWRTFSVYIFIITLVGTFLVFVPGLGFAHGGARRWVEIAGISFQPGEFLKIGYILCLASWLSAVKERVATVRHGLVPFVILSSLVGAALLSQPDTDSFLILFFSGAMMFLAAGARFKHIMLLAFAGIASIVILAFIQPYIMSRIKTFFHPANDPQGSGYQIQQSLIAIGSGRLTGRGFGQSIQKFNFLPEPIGDSIFAVAAEEFGFVGSVIIIFLFSLFALRGLRIAIRSPDVFSRLVTLGVVILIVSQSFLNMSAMLGVLPLSGLPLLFVSHGGSAMIVTLALVGIVLNISKYQLKNNYNN
ncbi:MAG: putative peptidoglycan glycosyltransferase FtsW [Candidatus Taylorbacteria bacterium]